MSQLIEIKNSATVLIATKSVFFQGPKRLFAEACSAPNLGANGGSNAPRGDAHSERNGFSLLLKEENCHNVLSAMSRTTTAAHRLAPDVRERYETVIGLEVHAQLETATKAFCACSTRFGDPPNTNVCPVCLGLPGALPVLNRHAVELAMRASLALHCEVQPRSRFARKNYFYPDLPKGYQISMYELPLARRGQLEIGQDGARKRVGITRVHMEEDAAKALHEGFPDSDRKTYIDFNRCGVPLIEIVSEPDLRTPEEAYAYLTTLKQVLEYTEVSDCNMEEGSLRCDANVSVRLRGAAKLGTKAEVKNLNSFRYLQRALEYEVERQIGVLEAGGKIEQETRLWSVSGGRTEPMRSKEFAHDYRYFPDPDLLPVLVSQAWKEKVRGAMAELPDARRARFLEQYGLTPYDAGVLTATRPLADYFEVVVRAGATAKIAANWIATELLRGLNDAGKEIGECPVAPEALAGLLRRVEGGEITTQSGKKVFGKMFATGRPAEEIIAAEGLTQMSDAGEIERICREVVAKSPENAAKYRAGNEGVFKFFVGQVMRETRGQANPQLVNDILKRILKEG
jgi:aspartyl-tRNA(Asn)/glutamyl-tRNA(Gln) amidotransferase subunit B